MWRIHFLDSMMVFGPSLLLVGTLACGGGGGGGGSDSHSSSAETSPAVAVPTITTQPANQFVAIGQQVTFTVVAKGTEPLVYQWRWNGTPISGASGASYTIASAQTSNTGSYTVMVSNTAGNVISSVAMLTVTASPVAPAITIQPSSQTVTTGYPATLSVVATGTTPLHYEWEKDGTPIGADSASLVIASAQPSDAGNYTVTVRNTAGNAPSQAAVLTVSLVTTPLPSFRDDFNGATIDSNRWQVAGWQEHGGQTSPARCYVRNGFLTLEFKNDPVNGYLSSAIQTWSTFRYGLWEARLKPSNVPGVLNSFYTIDWGTNGNGTKQEIDIEFLTKSFGSGKGQVHYAVHAAGSPSFETNPDVPLPFNPSEDFHVYGIEITPTEVRWTVDGILMRTCNYAAEGVSINAPYQLKLNAWSNTGWIGGPPAANTLCTYLIDWIQFTPRPE